MPRPTKARTGPNAIIASAATVIAGRRKNRPRTGGSSWQDEVWTMLDTVGELEFYHEWKSNAMSRVTLYPVEIDPVTGEEAPCTDPVVLDAMAALFGGEAKQPEMMAAMGGHIALPGETWLCGLVEPSSDPTIDQWRVLSHAEVREQGTRWQIDRGDGEPEVYDADEVYLTRIWRPHPKKWVEAHSSAKAALPILRELVGLSKHVAASIDSRLAGAGILAVPSEITFTSPIDPDDDADPTVDPFMSALIDAMVAAIEDRGDASALAPIVVKAPAEHLDKIKHITFWTDLSKEARELRTEAVTRLAASLSAPAEVLTGMADVNHWTGWLLDENAIKMHVEPDAAVIANGLCTRYLWPVLQGNADRLDPALRRFQLRADTSALRQRPNRSAEAQEGHAALILTDKAWARERGFEDTDLLSHEDNFEEFKRRLLLRAAQAGTTPDVAVAALAALGVEIDPAPATATGTPAPGAAPLPVEPAPTEAPENARNLPQQQAAALLAVSEVLVARAVERGRNRTGHRGKNRRPVPTERLDAALVDAWDNVPRAAALTGVDADRLAVALDTYARRLLTEGADTDPGALALHLHAAVLTPLSLGA